MRKNLVLTIILVFSSSCGPTPEEMNDEWFNYYNNTDCPSGLYDCNGICDGDSELDDCGICDGVNDCYGCTDEDALNYDDEATIDDGSCEYQNYEGSIVINEINYNPASSFEQSDTDYEFIELYNNYDQDVDMTDWNLSATNIDFTFGEFVLSEGGYIVLARNS